MNNKNVQFQGLISNEQKNGLLQGVASSQQ